MGRIFKKYSMHTITNEKKKKKKTRPIPHFPPKKTKQKPCNA